MTRVVKAMMKWRERRKALRKMTRTGGMEILNKAVTTCQNIP
jgi:hypothetical protein